MGQKAVFFTGPLSSSSSEDVDDHDDHGDAGVDGDTDAKNAIKVIAAKDASKHEHVVSKGARQDGSSSSSSKVDLKAKQDGSSSSSSTSRVARLASVPFLMGGHGQGHQ